MLKPGVFSRIGDFNGTIGRPVQPLAPRGLYVQQHTGGQIAPNWAPMPVAHEHFLLGMNPHDYVSHPRL